MIAVVLHLYYTDLWKYFEDKLKNIETRFDLYVTLCDGNDDISDAILKSFPNAKICSLPNKGQDIGPFLLTLEKIRNKNYNSLIKLHSKKSICSKQYNGDKWRDSLVNSLISSDEKINENLHLLKDSDYKMCGSKEWLLGNHTDGSALDYFDQYEFIGGTMFMVDFKLITKLLSTNIIHEWYDKMPEGYVEDLSFTHRIERLLGKIIIDAGYKIKGV